MISENVRYCFRSFLGLRTYQQFVLYLGLRIVPILDRVNWWRSGNLASDGNSPGAGGCPRARVFLSKNAQILV